MSQALPSSPAEDAGRASAAPLPRQVRIGCGLDRRPPGSSGTVPGLIPLSCLTHVPAVPAAVADMAVFLPKAWTCCSNFLVGAAAGRDPWQGGSRRPGRGGAGRAGGSLPGPGGRVLTPTEVSAGR